MPASICARALSACLSMRLPVQPTSEPCARRCCWWPVMWAQSPVSLQQASRPRHGGGVCPSSSSPTLRSGASRGSRGRSPSASLHIHRYICISACACACAHAFACQFFTLPCSITSICYNSYLPLLSRSHPRVVAAAEEERVAALLASPLMLTNGPADAAGAAPGGAITNPVAAPSVSSGSGSGDAAANPLRTLPAGTTDAIAAAGGASSAAALRITAPAVGAATMGGAAGTDAGSGATPLVAGAATPGSPAIALSISPPANGRGGASGGRIGPVTALEAEALVNDQLSNYGFAWGYVAGIIGAFGCAICRLVICAMAFPLVIIIMITIMITIPEHPRSHFYPYLPISTHTCRHHPLRALRLLALGARILPSCHGASSSSSSS